LTVRVPKFGVTVAVMAWAWITGDRKIGSGVGTTTDTDPSKTKSL
jgi:hypothetical protein